MRILYGLRMVALLLLVSGLFTLALPGPQKAQAQTISSVYVDPVAKCCETSGTITINLRMNLADGERINGFDVRLNYTNWRSVLEAQNLGSTGNVFEGQSAVLLAMCADDISLSPDINGCKTDDLPPGPYGGQVHFSQGLVGTTISGPLSNVLLFSINFTVKGPGSSLFILDRANLLNPGPDQFPNPHYVQVVAKAGVFGNSGLVAFFDFVSSPPAILPGQDVIFDSSGSFKPGVSNLQIGSYIWSWGDGTPNNTTGPALHHRFSSPGRYLVQLTITDTNSDVASIARTVVVAKALGELRLAVRDLKGSPFRWNVRVLLFNSTLSTSPTFNKTIDGAGEVVFDGLLPGTYLLKFSGPTVVNDSRQLQEFQVIAGWTSLETVYLTGLTPNPPSRGYGEIIFIGGILGGLGLVGTALVWQRRSQKKYRSGRMPSGKSMGGRGRRLAPR